APPPKSASPGARFRAGERTARPVLRAATLTSAAKSQGHGPRTRRHAAGGADEAGVAHLPAPPASSPLHPPRKYRRTRYSVSKGTFITRAWPPGRPIPPLSTPPPPRPIPP